MKRRAVLALAGAAMVLACRSDRAAAEAPVAAIAARDTRATRGLWVWHVDTLLDDERSAARLIRACRDGAINEAYLGVTHDLLRDPRLPSLVARLAGEGIHVEALMGDAVWYQPAMRSWMTALIDAVARYDALHLDARFEAIHLDIEPHTLAANRGESASYMPAYIETLRVARARAAGAGMTLSVDVPRLALRGTVATRRELVRAAPRLFLMLYELRGRASDDARAEVTRASVDMLRDAYDGIDPEAAGALVVGLSVADYGERLPQMLDAVASANRDAARFGGWAIHDFTELAERR